jgi:hypothetical protein
VGVSVGEYGELTYTPKITEIVPYAISSDWPLDPLHRGPVTELEHSLGFEKVDWIANFRRGYDVSFNNSYIIRPDARGKFVNNIQYDFTGIGHFIINDSVGLSARLRFSQWFNRFPDRHETSAGDVLRGIPDRDVSADYMLSFNLDVPIRILDFTPSAWISPKFRIFDFELYAAPVLDIAIVQDPLSGRSFHPKNMYVSGGLELIIFPAFMRSLYLRISPCFDLVKFVDQSVVPIFGKSANGDRNLELFFGMEFLY